MYEASPVTSRTRRTEAPTRSGGARRSLPLDSVKRLLAPVPLAAIASTVALIALLGYGVLQNEPDRSIDSALASGKRPPAPALDLARLDAPGRTSLRSLRGKVVVLNYWASWCPPCRGESPVLERWQKRIASRGGTVLGIDVLDVNSDARAFVRRYGLSYPILHDGDGGSRKRFDVVGQPETIFIDRRGRIAATVRGPVTERDMESHLPELLREPA